MQTMQWPSLTNLFGVMISRGSQTAAELVADIPDDSSLVPMSVRVHPRTRAYFEAQAQACGAPSASAMVAMVLEGVMAATKPLEERSSTEVVRASVALVRDRFLHLFHVHGFTPHMVADVLRPHRIGLADIQDDARLLSLLSDDVLAGQAARFGVSPDWLNGKPVRPIERVGDFHKSPQRLCRRIAERLCEANNQRDLTVLLLRRRGARLQEAFENDRAGTEMVGIVIRETHRTPGGKPFHYYEAWREVPWGYDQSRLSVKAIILWIERLSKVAYHKARFEGLEIDERVLHSVCSGGTVPAEALEENGPRGFLPRWAPGDYVAQPDKDLDAKETSERPEALTYYTLWQMDDEFRVLNPLNTDALARKIDATEGTE